MQAIRTVYNRYSFTTRLEARWAVFFDALGVRTPMNRRYDLGEHGYYASGISGLPKQLWVEIKSEETNIADSVRRGLAGVTSERRYPSRDSHRYLWGGLSGCKVPNYSCYSRLFFCG